MRTRDIYAPATLGTGYRRAGRLSVIGLAAVFWLVAMPALAADGPEFSWWTMGMQLCGGLAVFLFGMEQMAESLKSVAGDRMKDILGTLSLFYKTCSS